MTSWTQNQGKLSSISTLTANRNRHERENGNNKQAMIIASTNLLTVRIALGFLFYAVSPIENRGVGEEMKAILNGLAGRTIERAVKPCRPLL